jgi:hypothetical protein
MRNWILALAALAIGAAAPASAQQPEPRRVEQQVKGEPGKTIRIAVFASAKPDCTSGPLPTIRMAEPPASGQVTIRSGKVRVTNHKTCLAAEFPAFVAFYKPKPDFSGTDAVTLEVKNEQGAIVQIRKINITIAAKSQEL